MTGPRMRTLWRTTFDLFWQHLVLWLPVVLADLIAFWLRSSYAWATQAVIRNLVESHSILSSTPEPLRTLPVAWATLFGVARALVELLNVCLYTAAMISISIFVSALIAQTPIRWRQIPMALGRLRFRILLFSLKVLVLIAVAGILDVLLVTYLLPRLDLMAAPVRSPNGQDLAIIAIFFAAIGWVIAPSAVSLLRSREASPVETVDLRDARIFAAAAILSSVAVYFLFTVLEPSFAQFLTTATGENVFLWVASAASALPYVPLFIALSLIANQEGMISVFPTINPADENEVRANADSLRE